MIFQMKKSTYKILLGYSHVFFTNFHGRRIHTRSHHCIVNRTHHVTHGFDHVIFICLIFTRGERHVTSHHFHYHCIRRRDTYHESWYGALALSNFRKGIIDGRHIILTSIAALGEDRSRDTIRCLVLAEARSRDVTLFNVQLYNRDVLSSWKFVAGESNHFQF